MNEYGCGIESDMLAAIIYTCTETVYACINGAFVLLIIWACITRMGIYIYVYGFDSCRG